MIGWSAGDVSRSKQDRLYEKHSCTRFNARREFAITCHSYYCHATLCSIRTYQWLDGGGILPAQIRKSIIFVPGEYSGGAKNGVTITSDNYEIRIDWRSVHRIHHKH